MSSKLEKESPPETVNEDLAQSSFNTLKEYFSDEDAVKDRDILINKIVATNGEDKFMAYSMFVGFLRTGMVKSAQLINAITKVAPAEKAKVPVLVKAFLTQEPTGPDAIALMETIHKENPELLSIVILKKEAWTKAEKREQISKYALTESLWLGLGMENTKS